MKFQNDISNMNTYIHTYIHTYIRTSQNQYVPHFFKVGGIIMLTGHKTDIVFEHSENIIKQNYKLYVMSNISRIFLPLAHWTDCLVQIAQIHTPIVAMTTPDTCLGLEIVAFLLFIQLFMVYGKNPQCLFDRTS